MGIVFVALKQVTTSAKSNKTSLTLGNLKNMLTELDTATKLQAGPGFLYQGHIEAVSAALHPPANLTCLDQPSDRGSILAHPRHRITCRWWPRWPWLRPPSAERSGSVAILNTTLVMRALGRASNTRTAFEQFAAERQVLSELSARPPNNVCMPGNDRLITPA